MAEIDRRAPFRSVKEAVSLFGDKVYASKFHKEMGEGVCGKHKGGSSKLEDLTTELEETKEDLLKAREETMAMANTLPSLKKELEKTKRELEELKSERESEKLMVEFENNEDLKFVEDTHILDTKQQNKNDVFEKNRYVTFGNAPLQRSGRFLERHPSLKKKEKKQPLIPFIGEIFSRRKKTSEVASIPTSSP